MRKPSLPRPWPSSSCVEMPQFMHNLFMTNSLYFSIQPLMSGIVPLDTELLNLNKHLLGPSNSSD